MTPIIQKIAQREINKKVLSTPLSSLRIGAKVNVAYVNSMNMKCNFSGVIIAINNNHHLTNITVLNTSSDKQRAMEIKFPLYSKKIKITLENNMKPKVRRAKLYYLRDRSDKSAKIKTVRTVSKKA